MDKNLIHPSVIVRQHASVRVAEQEAVALWKNFIRSERRQLNDYYEIGLRLLPIRVARKGNEWLAWLKEIGIPQQRASEAIRIAENWKWITGAGSIREALKSIAENVFTSDENKLETDEIQTAPENEASKTEPEIDVSGNSTAPENEPPPDVGDAAELPVSDVLWGADGEPLPPSAKAAVEDKTLDKWLEDSRDLYQRLAKLPESPSGTFVKPTELKKRLSGIAKSVKAQRPDPKRMFRCPHCKGKGCETCRSNGWIPFTIWSDLK